MMINTGIWNMEKEKRAYFSNVFWTVPYSATTNGYIYSGEDQAIVS